MALPTGWASYVAQKVEHQHTMLKVAGSIPAEVHFPQAVFPHSRLTRLG